MQDDVPVMVLKKQAVCPASGRAIPAGSALLICGDVLLHPESNYNDFIDELYQTRPDLGGPTTTEGMRAEAASMTPKEVRVEYVE